MHAQQLHTLYIGTYTFERVKLLKHFRTCWAYLFALFSFPSLIYPLISLVVVLDWQLEEAVLLFKTVVRETLVEDEHEPRRSSLYQLGKHPQPGCVSIDYLCVCLSLYLSVSLCLSISFLCVCVSLSFLSLYLSISHTHAHLSLSLFIYPYIFNMMHVNCFQFAVCMLPSCWFLVQSTCLSLILWL